METAICKISVAPLRAEASHRSEMVSQLLFGESFTILAEEKDWVMIRTNNPSYEGWLQKGQYAVIDHDFSEVDIVGLEGGLASFDGGRSVIRLLHGALVPKGDTIRIGQEDFAFGVTRRIPVTDDFEIELPNLIKHYLHSPYLWGGRTVYGIDCSGLSQIFYRHLGIHLPRDARDQVEVGEVVDFFPKIQPGDLAFFDNEEGRITHVGIIIDHEHILHASGIVRIDRLDTQGIYREDTKEYTHKLRIVKRIIG